MMKNIRRSIKGDKTTDHFVGSKASHISLTPKSALTITPPKKVIKALESYTPASDHELGFEKGDFFHVIGRENDPEWYEACNPATNARGFVPVHFFQVLGKNERDSSDSTHDIEKPSTDKDSGYSDRSTMAPDRPATRGRTGNPLYGVVLYNFKAERPDELEAKSGEDIIVIAQSNTDWFVAKPIGRLGGPGLIPVDFVEIRDMVTGVPVEDTQAAIARAGVPKVEEWKKMAAEYKNSSISLGHFNGEPPASDHDAHRNTMQQQQEMNGAYNAPHGNDDHRQSTDSFGGQLVAPVHASVDSYQFENSRYWYVVNCMMEDGRTWSLCRFYEDFYDFQITLLEDFKEEAGHYGSPRVLPYMPGPVTYVTDTISAARCQSLDEYIKKLLSMPAYISKCRLVKQLFKPRPGDVETTHYRGSQQFGVQDHRRSTASQQSSDSSREPSRQNSTQNLNGAPGPNGYPGLSAPPPRNSQQRGTSGGLAHQTHMRSNSDLAPPRMLRQDSHMSSATGGSGSGQFFKIKIEYQDEMIAVRLPKDVSFAQLQDKLLERLPGAANLNTIQYKDESSGQVMDMFSDHDLATAISRNPKLKLFVN